MLQSGWTWKHDAQWNKPGIKGHVCHLYELFGTVKFTDTESTLDIARGLGRGEYELLFNGYRVSVSSDERVLEIVVMVAHHECTDAIELYT